MEGEREKGRYNVRREGIWCRTPLQILTWGKKPFLPLGRRKKRCQDRKFEKVGGEYYGNCVNVSSSAKCEGRLSRSVVKKQ